MAVSSQSRCHAGATSAKSAPIWSSRTKPLIPLVEGMARDSRCRIGGIASGGQAMPALYFELRRDGKPVNPTTWLGHQ